MLMRAKNYAEDAQHVGFFVFSKITDSAEQAESQREDDLGRLTRALPLYFVEACHYWSRYAARVYIMVAEGIGPVLSAVESDGHELFDIVPPTMTYFVIVDSCCIFLLPARSCYLLKFNIQRFT